MVLYYQRRILIGVYSLMKDMENRIIQSSNIEHGGTRTFFHMVDQYFGNDLLEPFESKFIGSTGLAMAYLWLSWPSLMKGHQDTFFHFMEVPTMRLPNVEMLLHLPSRMHIFGAI